MMQRRALMVLLLGGFVLPNVAAAEVTRLEIVRREAVLDGQPFGAWRARATW
ncbi:MAG TPA: hypothetical protein PLH72_13800 [Vicinamibacterales bacterium]|nr:hypothetical protein [Vicinamibacterales bacterium]